MKLKDFQDVFFEEALAYFKNQSLNILERKDFTLELLKEDIAGNKQYVYLRTGQHRSGTIYAGISSAILLYPVDKYFLKHENRLQGLHGTTISIEPKIYDNKHVLEFNSDSKISDVSKKIVEQYQDLILPLLVQFSNVIELDKYANIPFDKYYQTPPIFTNNGHWYRKMVLARLAGNLEYELICNHIFDLYKKGIKEYPNEKDYVDELWVAEQIYEELRHEKALLNPQLMDVG